MVKPRIFCALPLVNWWPHMRADDGDGDTAASSDAVLSGEAYRTLRV